MPPPRPPPCSTAGLPRAVEPTGLGYLLWARAETELAAGRPAAAGTAADEGLALDLGWQPSITMLQLVRMWARFDADGSAPDDPRWQAYPAFAGAPVEAAALGLLAGGGAAAAAGRFAEAAALWAGKDRRGELRCRWAAAEAARRAGAADAVAVLHELATRFEALGSAPLLGRVRRSLRVVVYDERSLRMVLAEVRTGGHPVSDAPLVAAAVHPVQGRVSTGRVVDAVTAEAALLVAVRGGGLLVLLAAPPEVAGRFVEDLQRLGPVDVRPAAAPVLADADVRLLELLARGATVGEAGRALHLSRRTVHRRLESIRAVLGVARTAQVVTHALRAGLIAGAGPSGG